VFRAGNTPFSRTEKLFFSQDVNEMQVLLTTHESTNFSNLVFLLIPIERK
jgi:hypothetical protein